MATETTATNGPSVLDLSDEELAKYATPEALYAAHPELAPAADDAQGNQESDSNEDDANTQKESGDEDQGTGEDDDKGAGNKEEGQGEGNQSEVSQEGNTPKAADKPAVADTDAAAPGSKEKAPAAEKPATDGVNYEAEYKRLLAPFKAAGKDMNIASVDEAIQLMQMGAGYARKMQALKPNLAKMKLLEQHGLLDETKLGFVIDLVVNKDPSAINKLLKDNGLDPMNLDPDKAGDYKPTRQTGNEREVELNEVLDQIEHEPHFQKLITTVTKEWDQASKDLIGEQPHVLKVLNAHMKLGYFDLITKEVDRKRALGELPTSVSHLAAYKQIGDQMEKAGVFASLGKGQSQQQQTPAQKDIVTPSKSSQEAEDKRNEKRRAAGTSKPAAAPVAQKPDFNPLALSDEEFAKLDMTKFQR
jgi:hypothetical protein